MLMLRRIFGYLLLVCPFVVLVVSHLDFKGGNLVLIASVPVDCFPFTSLVFCFGYEYYLAPSMEGLCFGSTWVNSA